ncbi:Chitotriosidase-1 [Eumeta japonica]|uniref:Chitotriosidase-1 n=1 Tax=Eumeta variegata TaxID=151549 RepID=A0A4C1WAJ1_EUMVA|nr:Chitotriosidase-1 [Eumeta japonica]
MWTKKNLPPAKWFPYRQVMLAASAYELQAVVTKMNDEARKGGVNWPPRLLRWTVTILLIAAVLAPTNSSNVRRRLRRPSKVTTSVSTSISRSGDQAVSASVNRPKIRGRPNIASRKSSAALDNSVATEEHKNKDGYKIVCYYTNWSQYRQKIGKFLPEDIQPDLCTHIIFAFGWLKKGKLSSFESNDETKDGKTGLYDRINNLKKANPKLKVLLAIGGWSFGTQKFKDMSATRYARQTFIYSAIPYLRDRNFDGLDVDWEYPKGGDDKKNYVLLLKEHVSFTLILIPERVRVCRFASVVPRRDTYRPAIAIAASLVLRAPARPHLSPARP